MRKQLIILIFSVAICSPALLAQEVISSGGSHAQGTNVQLSWTIGEPVTETLSGGSMTLTQGFHQSRLSSTAVDDILIPGLKLSVFPNPFADVLQVKVVEGDFSGLQYSLLTMEGKVLLSNKISKDLSQIDMQAYAEGNYLLKINRKTGEQVKTFKVIKQ